MNRIKNNIIIKYSRRNLKIRSQA